MLRFIKIICKNTEISKNNTKKNFENKVRETMISRILI